MIQKVLSHYHLPALTCFGLILFVSIFLGALIWVFRRGSSTLYAGLEQLPLEDLKPHFASNSPQENYEYVAKKR
jgi:cbb3-type cytochrome oxidase subunit 3